MRLTARTARTDDRGRGSDRTSNAGRLARLVATKVGGLVLTLLIASLILFWSRFLVPGDPMSFLLRGRKPSPEAVAEVRAQFGLDLPPWEQYWRWLTGMLQGDFGRSLQFRQDVTTVVGERLGTTLALVAFAAVIILVLGLAAGLVSSLHRGRLVDRLTVGGLTVLSAIPSFVAAIVLIAVFAVGLGWFPSFGSGEGGFDSLVHLTLPALALALMFIVVIGKVTRQSMLEQLAREHVEVATSRGIARSAVIRRHVLRNALRPIITVAAPLLAGLLVSSAIVETAFGLPGIGSLLVESVNRLDFPVVQALVLFVVAAFVVVNTIVDLLDPIIDPRTRAGGTAR